MRWKVPKRPKRLQAILYATHKLNKSVSFFSENTILDTDSELMLVRNNLSKFGNTDNCTKKS